MFNAIQHKINTTEAIHKQANAWRVKSHKLVFTNGCFDILHYGHIRYLTEARSLGDKLIIGINSSASVSRLKGSHRPINDDLTRSYLLASLQVVDAVVFFEEDTPYNLIEMIMPDLLVKGGDWKPDQIVGSDLVLKNGGEVKSLEFVDGYSTTNIEEKIKSA